MKLSTAILPPKILQPLGMYINGVCISIIVFKKQKFSDEERIKHLITRKEMPNTVSKPTTGQLVSNMPPLNNWAARVVNTPINEVIADSDIDAGKSTKVAACIVSNR